MADAISKAQSNVITMLQGQLVAHPPPHTPTPAAPAERSPANGSARALSTHTHVRTRDRNEERTETKNLMLLAPFEPFRTRGGVHWRYHGRRVMG